MPLLKKLIKISVLSFTALTILPIAYLVWSPGLDVRDGQHDLASNGLWMQHGWLGDDSWFTRYKKDPTRFRDTNHLKELAHQLRKEHIRDLFPHLCPCSNTGKIAPSNSAQVERFLDEFDGFRIIPWVGGINGKNALVNDQEWRKNFANDCAELLKQHPRLAGVHINIETMRSGNKDYLLLLDELRRVMPKTKIISIAAYPPPTGWQPLPEVHWDESYCKEVAKRVDHVAVMMYDTQLLIPKFYTQLMAVWTKQVLDWFEPREVLLGVPAYDDAGAAFHDPNTENLENSLPGIHAGIASPLPKSYRGISIYCEWEMTPQKWNQYEVLFRSKQ